MLTSYYTVKGYGEHEIEIQKSRFIAYIERAETEEEAQEFIQKIKKENWNATHNCSAYMIGENDQIQKANDDGEPSGTAGVPILEVLKKKQLKDTVVVITRYYGGIKLGAGGLIRAYGKATSEGLTVTGIVERKLMQSFTIELEYTLLGKFENAIRSTAFLLKNLQYLDIVKIQVLVSVEAMDIFTDWVTEISNGKANVYAQEQVFIEFESTS
ncbi:YigZ family protein [Mesobacillus jeotgali]|uniref:YigZ family protein n=1 Tax=Mesobacillus jeotgali TaxID=129985 RepID=A0ABY9VFM5_9BACI|nr:YigZ family protein [Mesobacillus jeotgali]WNF22625.1 YigZ family protein [Mesobacillus jeotgali]